MLDIKKGDKFRYACDWDLLGKPIWSEVKEAAADAMPTSSGNNIYVIVGDGIALYGHENSTVEII